MSKYCTTRLFNDLNPLEIVDNTSQIPARAKAAFLKDLDLDLSRKPHDTVKHTRPHTPRSRPIVQLALLNEIVTD